MKYYWLRDIDKKNLDGDLRLIADLCGMETLIVLLENFSKSGVYFSAAALDAALRQYLTAQRQIPQKQLARALDIDVRKVRRLLRE